MAYTKPAIIAQNASAGSYAAGCPKNSQLDQHATDYEPKCRICELGY